MVKSTFGSLEKLKNNLFSSWTEKINAADLPPALADRFYDRLKAFCDAAAHADLKPPEYESVIKSLPVVFTCSDFVFQACQRNPAMFCELAENDLIRVYKDHVISEKLVKACSQANDKQSLMYALRKFRNQEMVRIAWRDLAGWAGLAETLADLTNLAEACIDTALSLLYKWQAKGMDAPKGMDNKPVNLVVMGMGKLGARELNFSSDIDLVFAYQETKAAYTENSVSGPEFFARLCKDIIQVLGASTSDGLVFRMDMGLRPDGANGPLAMSFPAMEQYYENHGREWERYAWIKARPVAGDKEAGAELLNILNPFVYRKYLDYTVFESMRTMKRMIAQEVKRKAKAHDIKIGPGGIREIEFIGQVMQLIRGGVVPVLREPAILPVLDILKEKNLLPAQVCQDLSEAYVFLRLTENRLQEFASRQTHKLPDDSTQRLCLAFSMGFDSWEEFLPKLNQHRKKVHDHFEQLLADPEEKTAPAPESQDLLSVWNLTAGQDRTLEMLNAAGYDDPKQVSSLLDHLRNSPKTMRLSEYGRIQLDRLMPAILAEAGRAKQPEKALKRILDLVEAVCRRTAYVSLLLENPIVLSHLVRLCDSSPLIALLVTHHPALLDELLDPRILYSPPKRPDLEKELHQRLETVDPDDLEEQMEQLRMFKQVNILRVIAADVTGALPLMRVSDHLTDIAETILAKVLDLSWNHLVEKHGPPVCELDGHKCERGFAVVAYGKLGGIELGYGSDLDMVFVHAGIAGEMTQGKKPLYNGAFFARLGQRVIHILNTHTQSGILYETDMRLRPNGGGGLLVSHVDAFADYQRNQARTWEHQALVRARPVAGGARVSNRFNQIRRQVLCSFRNTKTLCSQIIKMRNLMKKELEKKKPGLFDVKQGCGGIVDIEFIVQFLVLSRAHEVLKLTNWTDNVRLLETIAEAKLLPEEMSLALKDAYLSMRAHVHALSREDKPALVPDQEVKDVRQVVKQAWVHVFKQ